MDNLGHLLSISDLLQCKSIDSNCLLTSQTNTLLQNLLEVINSGR